MYLGADDSHLYEQESFGIRVTAHRTLKVHAEHLYGVSQGEVFRSQLFFRLFGSSLHGHVLFRLVHAGTESLALFFHSSGIHMILLEFVEQLHGLIGVILCLSEDSVCFFVRLTNDAFLSFIQLFLLGFHLIFQSLNFTLVPLNFHALIFDGDTAVFQGGQYILKGFVLFADLFFCPFDDEIRKTELGRDGKGITLSGNADEETVRRP